MAIESPRANTEFGDVYPIGYASPSGRVNCVHHVSIGAAAQLGTNSALWSMDAV